MGFEGSLLRVAVGLYLAAAAAYIVSFAGGSRPAGKAAASLAWIGVACQAAMLVARGLKAGHVPLVSMYEYLIAFAWMVALAYLLFERSQKEMGQGIQAAGALALLFGAGLLWHAGSLPPHLKQAEPLMPVLRSYWLVLHVSVAVVGYGAAALASALACLYFASYWAQGRSGWLAGRLPPPSALDRATYRAIRVAFPFLTLVNITGAVWAYYAWGRYWGWDPKETWSLITWLVYVLYLHARLRGEWRAPKLNAVVLVGLGTIMFTFLGVNQLAAFSQSLHSYGAGS